MAQEQRECGQMHQDRRLFMNCIEESVIFPLPTDQYIAKKENAWRVKLPDSYIFHVKKCGGGIPKAKHFVCNKREYVIDRFLCILSEYRTHPLGNYDIGVTLTQIEDRLSNSPDLVGTELLPIAVLFAGDFVCLDYRDGKEDPCVCVWNHEESGIDNPVTYYVTSSYDEFLQMLY